jgi:predicted dehydrogenase
MMIRLALVGTAEHSRLFLPLASRLKQAVLTAVEETGKLQAGSVDGIVLCGAGPLDGLRAALATAKPVLTDFPGSSAELMSLSAESAKHGSSIVVANLERYRPSLQSIQQALAAGKLGQPGLVRIHRWTSAGTPRFAADIDLALWMFGSLPSKVFALARSAQTGETDYVQIHLGFPGGGMGLIDVSRVPSASGDYYSFSLIGSTGAAYADDHHNQQLLFRSGQAVALKTGEEDAARLAWLQDFADVLGEQRPSKNLDRSLPAVLRVCGAVDMSIASGQAAELSGDSYAC